MGDESAEGGFLQLAVFPGVEDEGGVVAELGEGLAAGSAGHGDGVVEVGYGYGAETDFGAVFGYGAGDGALLCAAGEAVRAVFHVAAGDDGAVFEKQSRSDTEVGVGRIGVVCGCFG